MTKKHWWIFAAIGVMGVLFFVNNSAMPFICDDFVFRVSPESLSGKQLWTHALTGAWNSYFSWGGAAGWTVIQFVVLNIDKPLFNILNTSVFLLFLVALWRIFRSVVSDNGDQYLAFCGVLTAFLLIPTPGQCLLWPVGCATYFFPMTAALLLIAIMLKGLLEERPIGAATALLMPIMGVLCGNSHGVLGGVIFLIFCGFCLRWRLVLQKELPVWAWLTCATLLLGIAAYVCAPGNFVRMSTHQGLGMPTGLRLFVIQTAIFLRSHVMICVLTAGLVLSAFFRDRSLRAFLSPGAIFAGAAFTGAFAICFTPFSPRSTIFFPLLCTIAIAGLTNGQTWFAAWPVGVKRWIVAALFLTVAIRFAAQTYDASKIRADFAAREKIILDAKASGRSELELTSFSNRNMMVYFRLTELEDIDSAPEYWTNAALARYYGVKSISGSLK